MGEYCITLDSPICLALIESYFSYCVILGCLDGLHYAQIIGKLCLFCAYDDAFLAYYCQSIVYLNL